MELEERHFTDLFATTTRSKVEECTRIIPKKVTVEMNKELLKEVSDKEIRDAAFSMESLKVPGLEGLNGLFFQNHWVIISREVCDVIKDIFASRRMPEDMRETIMVLIPKVKQPECLSQLRPISCSEVFTELMEEAQREGRISGVKLAPTAPVITHLMFADDCILFAEAKEEELYQIILIMNRYTDASGQNINLEKSGIVFG
ncbi:uncharacterized protein [Arachis hypogaea]|uniref:uncharacterized protein n=1 Tax=Arachis hypogaea TaxID=3818 RepID=UPI003B21B634